MPVTETPDESDWLEMLRALDPQTAIEFYNRFDLGGPRNHDKVMVRVHKERIAHQGLTGDERKVSEDWIAARVVRGRR